MRFINWKGQSVNFWLFIICESCRYTMRKTNCLKLPLFYYYYYHHHHHHHHYHYFLYQMLFCLVMGLCFKMNLNNTRPYLGKTSSNWGPLRSESGLCARWSQTPVYIGSLPGFAGLAREQELVIKVANFLYFIFDKFNVQLYNDTLRFTTVWHTTKKNK